MRIPGLLMAAVFLLFPVIGQVDEDVKLVNEFDPRSGCETMEIGLDLLFSEAADSQSMAYVVIHQGDNAFDNAIVHRKATQYVHFRNFPSDRYNVILTKGSGDIRVKLWIGKNGKVPPDVSTNLDAVFRDNPSRILLMEDIFEMVRIDGRDTYIGTGNPSCLYPLGSSMTSELLKANPVFDAEFLIKTKSSKRYRQLVAILKKQLIVDGVPAQRVRYVYGGRDKEIEGGGSKLASVAITFVRSVRK